MTSKFFRKNLSLILALILLSGIIVPLTKAATLELSPNSGTYSTGANFNVEIKVDTKDKNTQNADVVLEFDQNSLSIENVTYGSFYPTVMHYVQNGKLYLSGTVKDATETKKGIGVLGTISFKGLKAGITTVKFLCETGRTDESNVNESGTEATDILDCGLLSSAKYTLTGEPVSQTPDNNSSPEATANNATNSDSNPNGLNNGSTGTSIPNTGFMDVIKIFPKILTGLFFIAIGLIPLLI